MSFLFRCHQNRPSIPDVISFPRFPLFFLYLFAARGRLLLFFVIVIVIFIFIVFIVIGLLALGLVELFLLVRYLVVVDALTSAATSDYRFAGNGFVVVALGRCRGSARGAPGAASHSTRPFSSSRRGDRENKSNGEEERNENRLSPSSFRREKK